MHARVTELRVPADKLEELKAAILSIMPLTNQQRGFRGLVMLETNRAAAVDVRIITLWDSLADLDASEKNLFYYRALARIQGYTQGFPHIEVQEVLLSEIIAR